MLNSRSFRQRQARDIERQKSRPITHADIMRRKGSHRSIKAPGDIEAYKGGTRIPIDENESYKVYSFNMPGSNGSGEYKITSGNQTIIILSGVLFVNRANKASSDSIILRVDDSITFKKGDTVSFCPNNSFMSGIFIESKIIKLKKNTDPVVNNTGVDVFRNARANRHSPSSNDIPPRRAKTDAEREAFGRAYMAARGVPMDNKGVAANAAGIPVRTPADSPADSPGIDTVATNVETSNPQPMGDKEA